jgi:hypothetical protein
MEKNKTGKYFKYAIGKIVSIIIGILIALQINNWNDRRIEKKELDVVVYSMIEELDQNIQFLEAEKENKQNRLLALDKIKNEASSDQELKQIIGAFADEVKSKELINFYVALREENKYA